MEVPEATKKSTRIVEQVLGFHHRIFEVIKLVMGLHQGNFKVAKLMIELYYGSHMVVKLMLRPLYMIFHTYVSRWMANFTRKTSEFQNEMDIID